MSFPTTVEFPVGAFLPPTLPPLRDGFGDSTGCVFRCVAVAVFRRSTTFTVEGIVSAILLAACGKLIGRAAGDTAGLTVLLRKPVVRRPKAKNKKFIVN